MTPTSIVLRRAAERFRTTTGWADTWHGFSFGGHYDPDRVGFGALMVCNDELVQPGPGYADHPHAEAEIVSWVLAGALRHTDSAGHSSVLGPAAVQRLSAGRGVVHAERSEGELPVHFVQMWLRPDESGLEPSYATAGFEASELAGGWQPVVSGSEPDAPVSLCSRGSTLWATRLAPGERRRLPNARAAYLFVAAGAVQVEGVGAMGPGDALEVSGESDLVITGLAGPSTGSGRDSSPSTGSGSDSTGVGRGVAAEVLVWSLAG